MTEDNTKDETLNFVCESEESNTVEAKVEPVTHNDEQASSEGDDVAKEASPSEVSEGESSNAEDDSTGTNAAAEQPAKKTRKAQKRINEVVRQREDVKRENEALKAQIEELKGTPKEEVKEPVASEYESYDDYLDALDNFNSKPEKEVKGESKSNNDSEELTDSQKTALAVTKERVAESDKPKDFDEVALNPDLPITGDMLEALSECDDPAKVMYHLGQNKDLAAEIANKSTIQQIRAIVNLDLTVVSKPPKPTKITNAPDAISPVNGSDSQKKALHEMSFSEFEAEDRARNKQRNSTW